MPQQAHRLTVWPLIRAVASGRSGDSSAASETSYRLRRMDTDAAGPAMRTSVASDYDVSITSGEVRRRRIVRSATESFRDGGWNSSFAGVELFNLLGTGPTAVDDVESVIRSDLNADFRQLLFTNDSRLVRFIEPNGSRDGNGVASVVGALPQNSGVLTRVSERMNTLFLGMIRSLGTDIDIRRASITTDFRIVVWAADGSVQSPSKRMGGGLNRALAMAFVLALVEVSGIEAFSVMDAPLPPLNLPLRRAVLQQALEVSAQLIVALSYTEILGCEDILDKHADRRKALTNADDLIHDP